ncbi:MAG: hypothetical protein ACLP5H_30420 [Desulfomonilaceae bacterium]
MSINDVLEYTEQSYKPTSNLLRKMVNDCVLEKAFRGKYQLSVAPTLSKKEVTMAYDKNGNPSPASRLNIPDETNNE